MKLDIECVRDILITLEQQPGFVKMTIHDFSSLLPQYTVNQIIYTCWRLYEGGYINLFLLCPYTSSEPIIRCIGNLTFQGREFLADIKPKGNWDKLSDALKLGGSASFKAIANVAIGLGTDILKNKLKLTDN
ncbi:MAG: DUF2513 domain-containing protein [Eubacterium sp.]|nr:DUF2513 domain-containing protein [Eubacterium sp.]